MVSSRRVVSFALLAVVGLSAASEAQGSPPPPPHTGQATTTIALPNVTVTLPDGSTRSITLGSLIAHAADESTPFASLGLGGPAVLGTTLPGWQVDSSGGAQSGNHDIVLATTPVSGDVGIVNYDVHADPSVATSSYGALTATAATNPVDLQADLGQHGVSATVTPDTSGGSLALTVTGLQLRIGDLLPTDVIDALPLSGLAGIVSALSLPLPAGASSLASTLGSLRSDLTNAQNVADQLAAARATLAGLLAALPATALAQQQLDDAQTTLANDLAALQSAQLQLATDTATMQQLQTQVATLTAAVVAAQQQVATASAAVASWTAQVNSLTAQINSLLGNPLNAAQIAALTVQLNDAQTQLAAAQAQLTSAQAALAAAQAALAPVQLQLTQATAEVTTDQQLVTTLQQQVSADQAAVTAAQQALDALVASITNDQAVTAAQALVHQLTTSLTSAVATVSSDVTALPDLTALRNQLLATLTAAPLVSVGTLGATLTSTADDNGGSGTLKCVISGASVLGQSIPDGSCSALVAHFVAITAAVSGALDQLPVAAALVPTLSGLAGSITSTTPAAADTVTNGAAALTPLHLSVPSTSLRALADTTITALSSALSSAQQSFTALGLPAVTSALSGSLGTLAGTVSALPAGAGLAGLRTLGVDVSLVGLSTAAVHNRALPAAGPGAPAGSGSGSGTNGGSANPGTTDPPGRTAAASPVATAPHIPSTLRALLPFTGADSTVQLAAALLLLTAGAHLAFGVRRRRR